MKNVGSEIVKTSLYSYWMLHPEAERGTCEMISESRDERLAALLNVPTIDMEISYHAARCEECGRRLAKIVDEQLRKDWHGSSIVERLAEVKQRMDSTGPENMLK